MTKKPEFIHVKDDDYAVGYGKPPAHTQFKKGQSGNPRGRRSRVSYEEDEFPIRRFMIEPVEVMFKGKKRRLPRLEVVLMSLITRAMAGCFKSQKLLLQESGGLKGFREEWKRQKTQADQDSIDQVLREAKDWFRDDQLHHKRSRLS